MILHLLASYLLSANQVDYDGENLVFTGKFQAEHPVGILKGEKATLNPISHSKEQERRSKLYIEQGVSIHVVQGKTPFLLTAASALCWLPPHSLFSLYQLQELQFFDTVEIHILSLLAQGGSALYKAGSLYLYPAIPSTTCQLIEKENRIDAKEIRFDLLKEELRCIEPKGKIVVSKKVNGDCLYFSAQNLLWESRANLLKLQQLVQIEQPKRFSLSGDFGTLYFKQPRAPESFSIEGHVRLYSPCIEGKDSFSIADRIDYFLEEERLVLSAKAPRRVLFWQEAFSLSAPCIEITRDPISQREIISGQGDVHFTFDSKEKSIIEQFMSQHF